MTDLFQKKRRIMILSTFHTSKVVGKGLLSPRTGSGMTNRSKLTDTRPTRCLVGDRLECQCQGTMSAHGMATNRSHAVHANIPLCLHQSRKFFRNVRFHLIMFLPWIVGGIDVKAGTLS